MIGGNLLETSKRNWWNNQQLQSRKATRTKSYTTERTKMSDTEQHKKRKLEEAVDIKQEVAAQESAISNVNDTTTMTTTVAAAVRTERSAESDQQQIAREKEKIMKLLEPFSREQLVEILTSA